MARFEMVGGWLTVMWPRWRAGVGEMEVIAIVVVVVVTWPVFTSGVICWW